MIFLLHHYLTNLDHNAVVAVAVVVAVEEVLVQAAAEAAVVAVVVVEVRYLGEGEDFHKLTDRGKPEGELVQVEGAFDLVGNQADLHRASVVVVVVERELMEKTEI